MKLVYPLLVAVALLATGTDAWCIKGVKDQPSSKTNDYPGGQGSEESRRHIHAHAADMCNRMHEKATGDYGAVLCTFEPDGYNGDAIGQVEVTGKDLLKDACKAFNHRHNQEWKAAMEWQDREIGAFLCKYLQKKSWGKKGDCKKTAGS